MADDGIIDAVTEDIIPKGPNKVIVQMNKLKEANNKYKSLLKMAKDRISAQSEEMEALRAEIKDLQGRLEYLESAAPRDLAAEEGLNHNGMDAEESTMRIARVCQRVQEGHTTWALMEIEWESPDNSDPPKRFFQWKKFESEAELKDYIRRDTGEPLILPPVSLSPEQSLQIQLDAKQEVAQVTEEFRRFRVRSEVQRKQVDAHIRDLQSHHVQSAKRRIEGEDLEKELEQARADHAQLEILKNELAAQEVQWKEAYDILMAENQSLKASGSEALLAAQWRQRYESCLSEKEDLEARLSLEMEKADAAAEQRRKIDAGKYEMKYKDLKESFRLYRKKAKEIFEAQQRGDIGLLSLAESGTEDARLSYIRNLMVNYLSSDAAVREHMEGAIGTVLKFSSDDIAKIAKKKQSNEAWF